MDGARFDGITKSFVATGSRRSAVRSLAASAALAIGLTGPAREAAAKCVNPGKKCKSKNGKKKKCCGGAKCKGKRCKCPSGTIACDGACCEQGLICSGGQCFTGAGTCPTDGADFCNGGVPGNCNGNSACVCFTTMESATRCGETGSPSLCGVCTTDNDCLNDPDFGPGTFCAKDTGSGCTCTTGAGFCNFPCPS